MGKKQRGISNPKIGMSRTRSTYLMEESVYTFMLNGQSIDESGNQFTLSNEHSNILASRFKEGYRVVAHKNSVIKNKTYFLLFNPETGLSEIGYIINNRQISESEELETVDECNPCIPKIELGLPLETIVQQPHQEYVTMLSDCEDNKCLNFGLDRPIMIELKVENVGEVMAIAQRGNPPRYIELDHLEQYNHIGEEVCGSEVEPTCLDCDKMRIFGHSKNPIVKNYQRVLGGSLRKGVYEVALAYCDSVGNEKTSYTAIITPPISIFDEGDVIYGQRENNGKTNYSIKIGLQRLDNRYTHYKIVLIENVSETTDMGSLTYYEKGIYPTTQTDVVITENGGIPISPNKVMVPLVSIDSWEGLTSANGYLIGTGIKQTEEVNLQPVFNLMGGLVKWQSSVVKGDLYKAANSNRYKGYNRDEVYPFSVRPISEDGYQYPKYLLVGRPAEEYELEDVDIDDINIASINANTGECDGGIRGKVWQNFNTARQEGRCDSFNSAVLSFFGFNGEGDVLINGTPYNIQYSVSPEETAALFVTQYGDILEATEGVGSVVSGSRVILSPFTGDIEYHNINGSLDVEIDTRGLPTMPQNEYIEVITEVLPLLPRVIVTLIGTEGSGNVIINGNQYLVATPLNNTSLEAAARLFVENEHQNILDNEGLEVEAKNNTLIFTGIPPVEIYEGVTFENISGDLGARVSEPGIPPVPGVNDPLNSVSPISILPQYIDTYKGLEGYVNRFLGTCNVDDEQYYADSPLENLCPYINLGNLEEYNSEPIPEDGCMDPSTHFISETLYVHDIIGESTTYTPKDIEDYLDVAPPSNSRVFISSTEKGEDGQNAGIDTSFSGGYFLDGTQSIVNITDWKMYNPTVREKQYITYSNEPGSAVRLQNVTVENKDEFETVAFVHPYWGELLEGEDIQEAYIKFLPLTGGNGSARVSIGGINYNISYSGDINATAQLFIDTHSANIQSNHNLTLTRENSIVTFHGVIEPNTTPSIVNLTGNLRGEVSLGNKYLKYPEGIPGVAQSLLAGLLNSSTARNIFTERNATTYGRLPSQKIGNVGMIYNSIFGEFPTVFFPKIHKGAIWTKIEAKGREKFVLEITKMLEPNAPSLKRYVGSAHGWTIYPMLRSPYLKNTYVRYTLFEDEFKMTPLQEYREDLAKTEIEITGSSGTANIVINNNNYSIELQTGDPISRGIDRFIEQHAEAIQSTEGQEVGAIENTLIFVGDGATYDEVSIVNVNGDLSGTPVVTYGGYYNMGGIISLKENYRREIVIDKLRVGPTFNGSFFMVIDLPVTNAFGMGENAVPGDPGAEFYHSVITIPLGSCFSVVTRDEEFSEIVVDFGEIRLKKNQDWLMKCTFDVPIINSCKPIPHKYGKFAYWESTDNYPDNKELYDSSWLDIHEGDIPDGYKSEFFNMYGENMSPEGDYKLASTTNLACKPIRHFKFPDNKVSPFMYDRKTNRDADVIIYPIGLKIEDDVFNSFMDIAESNGLISPERRAKIIGYEVYRGDRRIDKSILSNGMLFDMRSHKNEIGDTIYYPNYPYNSLGRDKYNLDHNGGELSLDPTKNHIFTFHGPEQDYYKGNSGFSEVSVQGYMFGTSRTVVAEVEDHPKFVIMGDRAKSLATVLATIEVVAEAVANIASSGEVYRIQFGVSNSINPVGMVFSVANIVSSTINLVTTKVGKYRYEWLRTFKNLGSPTNFAYYTTSVAKYNYFRTLQSEENLFRGIANDAVLNSGIYSITENVTGKPLVINNLDRESSLMVTFTKDYPLDHSKSSSYLEYTTYDNNDYSGRGSQVLSSELGCEKGESPQVYRNVASPYVALKTYLPNQYGSVGNIRWVSTGAVSDLTFQDCGLVLGGDTFIVPHSIKRKMPLFKTTAFGQANLAPFAYGFIGNVGKPRFYIDYEINTERSTNEQPFPEIDSVVKTDCTSSRFYLEEPSKFYLYAYGQPEFFVESGINTHYRNARPEPWNQFYPQNQDFVRMTQEKTVPINRPNQFFYNYTYSYSGTSFSNKMLPDYYNAEVASKQSYNVNSAMYSQQDTNENSISEPWLSYKPNNYHVFPKSNGKLMALKGIENKQILAVFENTTEVYNAVDTFVRGITESNADLGTGGLFATGAVRTFSETDLGYIGSQSRNILSNEFGHIIVDPQRGQIFNINPGAREGAAQEISRTSNGKSNGMDVWFKEHLPFKILRKFPEYKEYTDNPYNGVGIAMGWDSKFRRVLITKKDYVPTTDDLILDGGRFYNITQEIIDEAIESMPGYTYEGIVGHKMKFSKYVSATSATNIYAFLDATSMSEADAGACSSALIEWFDEYKTLHEDYTGNLYILPILAESYLYYAVILKRGSSSEVRNNPDRPDDDFMQYAILPPNFLLDSDEDNPLWTPETNAIQLCFLDEASPFYHNGQINNFGTQITFGFDAHYKMYKNRYPTFSYLGSILYPIPKNNITANLVLQAIAAIEGKILTQEELTSLDVQVDVSKILTENPYEGAVMSDGSIYKPLKDLGWKGVYNKKSPASSVFSSETFSEELTGLIFNQTSESIIYEYLPLPQVEIGDSNYFKDVSWTITYKAEGGNWESYMDFKPNYYINHSDYFQTGVNNSDYEHEKGLWSHLLTNKSKQVFYGTKYPWVVEFPTKNEYAPKNLQGLEINSVAKRYHNEYDYAIDDRVTFNKLNIFSDSQSSGNLELVPNNGTLSMLSAYPKTFDDRQEILITRNNGKWTVNHMYNRVKSNRNNLPLFTFDENQINKKVNLNAVSFYGKPTLEQLTSENFLIRLAQDKTSLYDMELKFVIQNEEII